MQVIAELLGQCVAATTARYMRLQPEALRRAAEILETTPHGNDMATNPHRP